MRKLIYRILVIQLMLVILAAPAFAGWKVKIAKNQVKTLQYVALLKNGANPDTIERPYLRYDEKSKAKQANKEMKAIMREAEEKARAGKHKQIGKPVFKYELVSDAKFKELQKELKKK